MARPRTLWLYPALLLQPFVAVTARGEANATVGGAFLLVSLVAFLVWRGSRAAWVLATVFQLVVLVSSAFDPRPPLWAVGLNLVALVALAAPPTLRWVWRARPEAEPPPSTGAV